MAGPVENQVGTGREEPVWPDVARFSERSLCKVHVSDTDGVGVPDLLARDVAPCGAPTPFLSEHRV